MNTSFFQHLLGVCFVIIRHVSLLFCKVKENRSYGFSGTRAHYALYLIEVLSLELSGHFVWGNI